MSKVRKLLELLLLPKGKINRVSFFFVWLLVAFMSGVVTSNISIIGIPLLITNYILFCLLSKRLRSIGLSGRLAILPFAFLATIYLLLGPISNLNIQVIEPVIYSTMVTIMPWAAYFMLTIFIIIGLWPSTVNAKSSGTV